MDDIALSIFPWFQVSIRTNASGNEPPNYMTFQGLIIPPTHGHDTGNGSVSTVPPKWHGTQLALLCGPLYIAEGQTRKLNLHPPNSPAKGNPKMSICSDESCSLADQYNHLYVASYAEYVEDLLINGTGGFVSYV